MQEPPIRCHITLRKVKSTSGWLHDLSKPAM